MIEMKDSGVDWIGNIPEDWQKSRIKDDFSVVNGATPKSGSVDFWDGDIIWLTPTDMREGEMYLSHTKRRITKSGLESCGTTLVPKHSVIVSNRAPIGKIALADTELCTNQGCKCLVNNSYDNRFVYYFLSIQDKTLNMFGRGTTFMELSTTDLANFIIPKPSKLIETRISDYLDKKTTQINLIIDKTKQSIEEYKKYKQSLISEAVTKGLDKNTKMKDSGVEWIGQIPEHWDRIKIKYIFSIRKRIAGELGHDVLSVTQKGLKIKNLESNDGQLSADYSKYQHVYINDFVMNHMDLLTGWVDLSCYNGVTSPDYRVFTMKETLDYSKEFFKIVFQMYYTNKIFYGMGQGVSDLGRWRLQADKFNNASIPLPPVNEQIEIANFVINKLSDINDFISKKENLLSELETYKESLIYELVTGKKEII